MTILIYLTSVMLMIAYANVSKFAALENRSMFLYFLWTRPIFIVIYSTSSAIMDCIRNATSEKMIARRKRREAKLIELQKKQAMERYLKA